MAEGDSLEFFNCLQLATTLNTTGRAGCIDFKLDPVPNDLLRLKRVLR